MKIDNTLIVVPARSGSKGVKNKNMYLVNGKPLIGYTFKLLKEIDCDYCISTDDSNIIDYAKELDLDISFIRPQYLAGDTTKMLDVLIHSILQMENLLSKNYQNILLLQPTAPLRNVDDIHNCVNLMRDKQPDSVISVNKVDSHHPILMKKISNGYLKPYCIEEKEGTRRQDYKPDAFMRNGAIYLTKRDLIINEKSIWGDKIMPYIMEQNKSVSIDNLIDFKVLESIIKAE